MKQNLRKRAVWLIDTKTNSRWRIAHLNILVFFYLTKRILSTRKTTDDIILIYSVFLIYQYLTDPQIWNDIFIINVCRCHWYWYYVFWLFVESVKPFISLSSKTLYKDITQDLYHHITGQPSEVGRIWSWCRNKIFRFVCEEKKRFLLLSSIQAVALWQSKDKCKNVFFSRFTQYFFLIRNHSFNRNYF